MLRRSVMCTAGVTLHRELPLQKLLQKKGENKGEEKH